MDVYEAVIKRRSIRRFKDLPIPYDVLEKCVDAARLAPSGRNSQPCEYVIVDDDRLLPEVFDNLKGWAGQPSSIGAPPPGQRPVAYIIILINNALEMNPVAGRRVATYDVALAAENAMLVATAEGIGSCPFLSFKESTLKEVLNLPDNYEIALVLGLGYADESPVVEVPTDSIKYWVDDNGVRHVPKRKLEDILHRNKLP